MKKSSFLLFLTSFILVFMTPVAQAAPQPLVRVGLWTGQQSVVVGSSVAYAVETEQEQPKWASFKAGEQVVIAWKPNGMTVNGKTLRGQTLYLRSNTESARWEVNRKKYRGDIVLRQTTGKTGLTVVNEVPMEEYLYGILGKEISAGWPAEAAKAQAVAARSYALNLMLSGDRHRQDGYDLCATVHCQVYGGVDAEAPDMIQAVAATNGLAAYYNGQPIHAYFHASSGGHTEDSENVWGNALPYLRGVSDVDAQAPGSAWEKRFNARALETLLTQKGKGVGVLKSLDLSPLSKPGADRTESGRVRQLQVAGDKRSLSLSGVQMRSYLDLPSALFDIRVVRALPSELDVSVETSYGATVEKKMPVSLKEPAESGRWNDPASIHRIIRPADDIVIFSGHGRGHGVGMSQWGARLLAEKNKYDYKQILQYYYQGIMLKKAY